MGAAPRIGFVIGGVQKGGTTALARFLGRHPQLALPAGKEAHVFDAPDFDECWTAAQIDARYAALFPQVQADAACLHGDATPIYGFHPRLVARIARYNPRMRWILILRHPVERAFSHYQMERARGGEPWPLWPALLLERWRLRGHADDFSADSPLRRFSYRARGGYARQLDALYAHFPRRQVLLLRNAELSAQPQHALARVCAFLGVAPLARAAGDERIFEGGYLPLQRGGWRWRCLAWLLRGELRAARRHGIEWE